MKYPNWSCTKKVKSRDETIISMYRSIFRKDCIPLDKQYWTMCGQNSNEDGSIRINCEFDQITSSGLIKPSQFFGVERDFFIHSMNKKVSSEANWVNGDFYDSIVIEDNKNNFKPAIVNIDNVKMPHSGGIDYASRILSVVDVSSSYVMVVCNLILKCYSNKYEYSDMVDCLYGNRIFQKISNRWKVYGYCYVYDGSNDGKTTEMGSLIFWKTI